MQSDRVRPVGRARAEHTLLGVDWVPTGVHAQHVPLCSVKPCEDEDLGIGPKVAKALADVAVENEPGVGRTLVALQGRSRSVEQGGLDRPDWSQVISAVGQSMYFIASSLSEWSPIRQTGSNKIDSSAQTERRATD